MIDLIWLTIALPLLGVLINGLLGGRFLGRRIVNIIAPLMVLISFIVGVLAFLELGEEHGHIVHLWPWATIGDFNVNVSLLADQLSLQMVLIITGIGFLIHVYATEYMVHKDEHGHAHADRDYTRFFTFLNLFIASMLILVLGDNYLMMYVGWELVGVSSYLLIGYWYDRGDEEQEAIDMGEGEKPVPLAPLLSPSASGMKAFIVNRIGDFGYALGIFLIWSTFGTLSFLGGEGGEGVFQMAAGVAETAGGKFTIGMICFLLFIGAMGKSAQLPLYIWLPDAMAGPTPVSALIHAATMVTAGIYMIVRSNALYSIASEVSLFIAIIGAATALGAATIALVQVDLKRVLAYSTVSQLGYMFLAVGVGAYTAGMFHLTTHAFFKALLFLGAGAVMHSLHDVIDIRRMGGLFKKMPWTGITFIIGGLALAGFPLTSGFWSKDEILAFAFKKSPLLWAAGIITAGLTAFYTFRAIFLAFFGPVRDKHLHDHAHESGPAILTALIPLAVLSLFGGLLGLPIFIFGEGAHFLEEWLHPVYEFRSGKLGHLPVFTEWVLLTTSAVTAVAGIALAYYLYIINPSIPDNMARRMRPLYEALVNKWYVDELYDVTIVKPLVSTSKALAYGFDKLFIDNILVDGLARLVGLIGTGLSTLQTGYLKHYALATFVGVLVMISYFFL